ncbi:PREDICTED: 39S ribosomal protein L34, mitochondrial-like [Calidris pugnax]|uniref:39S ribosomal protein L34, mitochondrial-like n=1 Tax=Calidris pugnax TaxID=198806 RepID=UPI00071DE164|nr:PREDICTED: 39S ribosomal protein L34, mitochondrial-like [Calidris pugnax]XP_014817607.1 PREDICTED: 39S ribosomal protein L34, mitochondrial-like [Calidris pugnax]
MAALGRLWAPALGGRFSLLQRAAACPPQLRAASVFSSCLELPLGSCLSLRSCPSLGSHPSLRPAGGHPGLLSPWNHQQVRTKARGNEYQPNNRKRKRTHGWIKRISTPGGIEVILRRMLKGRKSLTH